MTVQRVPDNSIRRLVKALQALRIVQHCAACITRAAVIPFAQNAFRLYIRMMPQQNTLRSNSNAAEMTALIAQGLGNKQIMCIRTQLQITAQIGTADNGSLRAYITACIKITPGVKNLLAVIAL